MTEIININRFLDSNGKIVQLPQKKISRAAVICYLADKFEDNRDYTEKEVNAVCNEWHTFGDCFILRRGLVESALLCRERDGSRYWKTKVSKEQDAGECAK